MPAAHQRSHGKFPMCRVFLNVAQNITTATLTVITFDTVSTLNPLASTDIWGMWPAANKSRLVVPNGYGGLYVCTAGGAFAAATDATRRIVQVRVSGTTVAAQGASPAIATAAIGTTVPPVTSGPIYLNAGDYIETLVRHDSATTPLATLTGDTAVWMSLAYHGPA